MSVIGIASSGLFRFLTNSSSQSNSQDFLKEFQQLGQDLQSGNLSAAQQDYSTVQQDLQHQFSSNVSGRHHHHHHFQSPKTPLPKIPSRSSFPGSARLSNPKSFRGGAGSPCTSPTSTTPVNPSA